MTLVQQTQAALKTKKIVLGYRKSLEYLKNDTPKTIVIASNIQENKRAEIEHNAKLSGVNVEVFEGNSKELGVICGKPFPVSALIIKK
jgi:large subunit ribosomal protein L30e